MGMCWVMYVLRNQTSLHTTGAPGRNEGGKEGIQCTLLDRQAFCGFLFAFPNFPTSVHPTPSAWAFGPITLLGTSSTDR